MKKYMMTLILIVAVLLLTPSSAFASDSPYTFVFDLTEKTLSESELIDLNAKANASFAKHQVPMYILIYDDFLNTGDNTLETTSIDEFTKNLFEENELGNPGGLMLVLSMSERDWALYANDEIDPIYDKKVQDHVMNQVLPFFKEDRFSEGFDAFISASTDPLAAYANGEEFVVPRATLPFYFIFISLGVGFVISLGIMYLLTNPLRTVASKVGASGYLNKDSLHLSENRDIFLYRNVTRRAKEKSSESSSGGTSSSGKF